ncbi:MAG: glycosyltransferase, partial [Bdellovibrionales bacterium]|nr:glycosyltransferase [Bdellovibrionales bacterium]
NDLMPGFDLEQINSFFEDSHALPYPELPSSVGHCTYYKREMLEEVGYFDEENFGLGYGEENDLSCRALAKGWVDVLDTATFIYHKENTSFGAKKQELTARHTEKLRQLHPHYFDRVSKFCSRDPIRPFRMRVLDEMLEFHNTKGLPRVLHIVHNGPHEPKRDPLGGTELHVQDMIDHVRGVNHWSLTPLKTCYILTAHIPGAVREYILPLSDTSLKSICNSDHFDVIHLHHSRWLDHAELCEALRSHGNYVISFHDFTLVCPRMHLYTPFHKACNRHECSQKCGYSDSYIGSYRNSAIELFKNASKLIAFSHSTTVLVEDALKSSFSWTQVPHGIHGRLDRQQLVKPQDHSKPFKIAFLGYVPLHKGSLIVEKLVQNSITDSGRQLEWHMIGKLFLETDKVVQHGEYERSDLQDLIKSVDPDLVMILSLCPETYCMTLDEAWSAGVPTLVTPLGAPPERVQASGAGWVVPELHYDAVWEMVQSIVSDPEGYQKVRAAVASTGLRTVDEEAAQLGDQYREIVKGKSSFRVLQAYLTQFGLLNAPKAPFHLRVLGKLASIAIYTLDSLKLRYYVQTFVSRTLPRKFYQALKSAR